jgi:hypothetical protein
MYGIFLNAFVDSVSAHHVFFTDWFGKKVQLDSVCIDDFVIAHDLFFVHILHSDIQGAEYAMLLGAEKTIAAHKLGYIFVSTHSDDIHNRCLSFLQAHNFNIVASHTVEESYSFDGLIVAKSSDIKGVEFVAVSKRKK